jgi:hypothetical protein
MTTPRRKQIQGGAFDRAKNLPERDVETATRQMHGERTDAALAKLDKPELAVGKPVPIGRAKGWLNRLEIPADVSSDEFREIGVHIFKLEGVTNWWKADYIIYSAKWGDIVNNIAEHFVRDPQTLYNVASIGRKFEISRRREVLTFSHHAVVAAKPIEKQEEYLDAAAAHGMSEKELRAYIREQEKDPDAANTPPYEPVGADYRRFRGRIATLLRQKPTPQRLREIASLVERLHTRLAEEAAWLQEVQKLMATVPGKTKEADP